MVDRALDLLQRRADEVRELLQGIDGAAARQMELEMDKIQEIIDAFRSDAADPE